jgi:hypothetical protein
MEPTMLSINSLDGSLKCFRDFESSHKMRTAVHAIIAANRMGTGVSSRAGEAEGGASGEGEQNGAGGEGLDPQAVFSEEEETLESEAIEVAIDRQRATGEGDSSSSRVESQPTAVFSDGGTDDASNNRI